MNNSATRAALHILHSYCKSFGELSEYLPAYMHLPPKFIGGFHIGMDFKNKPQKQHQSFQLCRINSKRFFFLHNHEPRHYVTKPAKFQIRAQGHRKNVYALINSCALFHCPLATLQEGPSYLGVTNLIKSLRRGVYRPYPCLYEVFGATLSKNFR